MIKTFRNFSVALASTAMIFVPSLTGEAQAATTNTHSKVIAEVNGKSYPAIMVGADTYVSSAAFTALKTPNQDLGSGKFAVTGGMVQGVVYQGKAYVPWSKLSAKVKATKLPKGGYNFTAVAVPHHYQIAVQTSSAVVGSPTALDVMLMDGNIGGVPHQQIQVQVNGSSYISGPPNSTSLSDYTDENGEWVGTADDGQAEPVQATITWTDPTGKVQTKSVQINYQASTESTTVTPTDDTVVSTLPITTYDSAVLLNAESGGNDIAFQLDTGAFSPVVTKKIADQLKLPNLGSIQVEGIGGLDNAYLSQMTMTIGGVEFKDVPCVVDENYTGYPLLGYSFFTDNGYDILLSQKHQSLTILK